MMRKLSIALTALLAFSLPVLPASAGARHVCYVDEETARVECVGDGSSGQLGEETPGEGRALSSVFP